MNLSIPIQLKSEPVTFGGQDFQLYELSAYHRCEYLEKTSAEIPISKDDEPEKIEFKTYGDVWAFRGGDVKTRLLLVAYSLWTNPDCENSLEDIYDNLIRCVSKEKVDSLYVPAAKLSGLYTEPKESEEEEESEKKD
ncbi:phage minor tail protein domain-containing protein [Microbulbifer sp. THAF38]|uniref:phage minor tail protein domain-containing protein n=1 Tax=Microbulbifer sp. THAF38 TaxID=2587856 RepID=UPI0012683D3D|nr:phage minor tail protein G [Microbulbifer sp. THAF38]QFT53544.1 Bacteriophage lambda minor tail protein (GpG) [Microbulbifer sp. THAF38]